MSITEETISLPNETVKNALKEILENNLGSKYELNIESGSGKGDNYIGVVYRAKASNQDEKLNVIIKVPPQNEIRRKQFFARPCFLREAFVYDEIIPSFIEFQKSKGISTKHGFHETPDCYKTLTEENFEAIILKDLKPDGFEMFSRLTPATADHAKLLVRILGKFHAISFAMKDQCPEMFAKYKDLQEILLSREDDMMNKYMDDLKTRSLECLGADEQDIATKVEQAYGSSTFKSLIDNMTSGKLAEPYAVVCHGDCWNNNILFRNEGNKPVEAKVIDWQLTKYASPVCDLMYYFFTSTTKEMRDEHYFDIIEEYYQTLSTHLTRLGSDPEKVFPRVALDEQLKTFGKFGMLMAMMLLPVITSAVEDIPDLDELSEKIEAGADVDDNFKSEKSEAVYRKRMRDVFVDMANFGYI